jgi:TorA maturation chaperone TorD
MAAPVDVLLQDPAAPALKDVYAFLANVLTSRPTADSVGRVRRMAEVLGIACPEAWPMGELEQDYVELFVVPNPRYVAPYESVYRDAWLLPVQHDPDRPFAARSRMIKGLVMGESTAAVRKCYEEASLVPSEELPDHIANELRFMAYLVDRETQTPQDGSRYAALRARFRNEHLLKWVGRLRDRILESERPGYYSTVLTVAELVLRSEP